MTATAFEARETVGGPGGESGENQPRSGTSATGDEPAQPVLGPWLDLATTDPEKCAKEIVREWERQDPAFQRRKVVWDRNTYWLSGYVGVRALPSDSRNADTGSLTLFVPTGTYQTQPPMPRAKLVAMRQTAHLFSDQPSPEPEPMSDSDADRDAAEFAKRILLAEGNEAGLNYPAKFVEADEKSSVFGSAFLYIYTDATGGGVDATTGDWTPKVKGDVLTGKSVRMLPETCTGIDDADGVLILWVRPYGQLKAMFPAKLAPDGEEFIGEDALSRLVSWRNPAMDWVLPWYAKMGYTTKPTFTESGTPSDNTLVGCLVSYYKQSPTYPQGAYLIAGGNVTMLHAGSWVNENETGTYPLDLPLSQFRQYVDIVSGDPYGVGLVSEIGPADEVINTVNIGALDHIDRFLRPNMLVPMGSRISPDDYVQRSGIPMEYNAGAGSPFQEQIGQFDPFAQYVSDSAKEYQDQLSSLGETAQGLERASVTSGKQAAIIVQQSDQNLSGRRQRVADAVSRTWRLILQQVSAFFPPEIQVKYATEDGAYTQRAFATSSLTSIRDVKIAQGTFSQLTPAMKVNMAVQLAQIPGVVQNPAELQRIMTSGIQPLLGVKEDPAAKRVRRQLAVWVDGPDDEWLAAAGEYQSALAEIQGQVPPGVPPEMGQAFVQEQTQALGLQPPPSPFDDVPSDHEQEVALIRHREIRRVSQQTVVQRHPEPWRNLLFAALETARRDAGILTVQEQQQAAAQQAQMESQEKEKDRAAKKEEQEDKQDFEREQAGASNEARIRDKMVDTALESVGTPPDQTQPQ